MMGHIRMGVRRALAAALAFALGAMVACGGGGGGVDEDEDITVGVTSAGNVTTLEVGQTLALWASVQNSSTNMDVTWSLTGPACPSQCGTVTRTGVDTATYTAPATAGATFGVMVTATSVEDSSKTGSVQLTVNPKTCPARSDQLSGRYALLLQGFDPATTKALALVGSFRADGCGLVTDGAVDIGGATPLADSPVSGSYTVGADRRGTLTLSVAGTAKTFALSLGRFSGGVAQRGGVLETLPAGTTNTMLEGTMWAQDANAFAQAPLAGGYAYLLNGWTADIGPGRLNERLALGGTVTRDDAGRFTAGLQDLSTYDTTKSAAGTAWSGSAAAPAAASGRSTLSADAFAGVGSAVAYVVSAQQQLVLVKAAGGAVVSGQMVRQTGPFAQDSLSGSLITNQTQSHWGYGYMNRSILAVFTADGASPTGTLTTTLNHDSSGCNLSSDFSSSYGYEVAANGQVSLYLGSGPGRVFAGRWYLTRRNAGFLLGLDASVPVGELRPRSAGPYSMASFNGSWFATQGRGSTYYAMNAIGTGSSAGDGLLAMTMDTNQTGAVTTRSDIFGGALTDLGSGRFTDAHGHVIYAVAPNFFLASSWSGSECYPLVHVLEP